MTRSRPDGAPEFGVVVGVDQTGAALRGGRLAKPLPAAVATWRAGGALEVVSVLGGRPLALPRLDRASVEELVQSIAVAPAAATASARRGGASASVRRSGGRAGRVALLLDCVFGLSPESVGWAAADPLRGTLAAAARFAAADGALYGRAVSEAFFATRCPADGTLPRRLCERLARANSVFTTRPFQKNIQTGTFRMWRELGESLAADGDWLAVWPFDPPSVARRFWAFEAFPSLLWRELLLLPTRDRTRLRAAARAACRERGVTLRVTGWERLEGDADAADAFVLALGGALLDADGRLREPAPGFAALRAPREEGWIAGLRPDAED